MILSPRQFVLAAALIVACITMGLVAVSNAARSEPTAAAPSSDDQAVLERILADWRLRQERITSLHVEWDSRWTSSRNNNSVSSWCQREFWIDERGRYRLNVSAARISELKDTSLVRGKWIGGEQWSFNGATGRMLEFNPVRGLVSKDFGGIPWSPDSIRPVLLGLRPLAHDLLGLPWRMLRVVSVNAIIGKTHCIKLRKELGIVADNYWVDPARDHAIVAWERLRGKDVEIYATIDYRHNKQYGWVPVGWTQTNSPLSPVPTVEQTITNLAINERIADSTFTLEFPARTTILDRSTLERYTVAKDGSKTILAKWDSPESLMIGEALDQATDFNIDPEPLKDALEFIAQRYLIKVTIDAQAVRQGLIDPSIEVKTTTPGIKLREVVALILKQSPKPLAYEVRNGALTVIPAPK
jgi:hypothetical protein